MDANNLEFPGSRIIRHIEYASQLNHSIFLRNLAEKAPALFPRKRPTFRKFYDVTHPPFATLVMNFIPMASHIAFSVLWMENRSIHLYNKSFLHAIRNNRST